MSVDVADDCQDGVEDRERDQGAVGDGAIALREQEQDPRKQLLGATPPFSRHGKARANEELLGAAECEQETCHEAVPLRRRALAEARSHDVGHASNITKLCPLRRVYDSPMADSRRGLLTAALELLQERGPSALRVRDVAVAAGTSTMGVYTYFGSKQGLVEELYLHGFRLLTEELEGIATSSDSRRHLLALTLAYRAFALDNEALYGLMFERAIPEFIPSKASRLESLVSFQLFVERVRAWHGPAGDPDRDAYLIWCTVHGLVSIELTHRRWGGPVMEHLVADGESTFASAIGSLLDALDRADEASHSSES